MKCNEHQSQSALFKWAALSQKKYPGLELMFAIPNGGHRHVAVAAKMKREGVKAGVPDIFLPVPRKQWHGLFVEMKSKPNKPTPEQVRWLYQLEQQSYKCAVCYSAHEAIAVIEEYFSDRPSIPSAKVAIK